ncbi:unnamed protein product, partial [Owenia fusiformis]
IIKDIKRIIHAMVGARAEDRISTNEVKKHMDRLHASVKKDIPPSALLPPQPKKSSTPAPPLPPRKSPSGEAAEPSLAVVPAVTHRHTKCSGCKQSPIKGIRYLCYKHRDCSWCASCRAQGKQYNDR